MMTDWLRNWVLGLAGTATVCAAATALTPNGRVKRVVELLCGVMMASALLLPLLRLELPDYALHLAQYRAAADSWAAGAEEISRNLDRSYIESQLEAYILDKALRCGASLDGARVELRWSTEGVWVPVSAELSGAYCDALAEALEAELGIARSAQTWRSNEDA